ncbi:MAG: protein TolQ [Rhodospirillales bacterium]
METAVSTGAVAGIAAAQDFSLTALFLKADWVVKSVMIMLVLASVWCWTVIFEKTTAVRRLNRQADVFEADFWSGRSLEDLFDQMTGGRLDPMTSVFSAAMREWRRRTGGGDGAGPVRGALADRIDRVMQVTLNREMDRVERRLTFLATTGATAPFVGLFGTVWGIMNSFQSIALTKNTSLAVVAPGIAEALFATALGLLAAIPAVVAYNKISKDLDRYSGRLETFAGEFAAILSREMDRRG